MSDEDLVDLSDDELVDPRYQEPLQPGWWKTGSGWRAVLSSHRIDRRAKPAVILVILLFFLVFNYVTEWEMWRWLAAAAGLLIVTVVVFSPLDAAHAQPRQPLEHGWWRTADGWKRLFGAGYDEPGVGVVWLLVGLLIASVILLIWRSDGLAFAALVAIASSEGLWPRRTRLVARVLAIVVAFLIVQR